jgi:hypothetical protein
VATKTDTGITPEQARDVRAAAWRYVFECFAKKKGAGVTSTNGDDAKEGSLKHEDRATPDYTRS